MTSRDTPTSLLAEITAAWAARFAADEDINGGDFVEWAAPWLQRAQAALDAPLQPDPSRAWRIPNTAPAPLPAPQRDRNTGEHQFRVGWEIDIYAESAEHAARKALAIQRSPASIATVFNVSGGPGPFEQVVDCNPEEGGESEPPAPGGPS